MLLLLTPAGNSAPLNCLLTPLWWDGRRIGRGKMRKFMAWNKESLIGDAKAAHANRTKQGIPSPLPMDRQVFSRALSCMTVTCEDKHCQSKHSPFLLPSAFKAEHDLVWHRISQQSVGVSCLGCVPSPLLCTRSPLTGGVMWEAKKGYDAGHCPAQ